MEQLEQSGDQLTASERAEDAPPDQPGQILGSYQLIELIGQGSMGRVYLARHLRLGRAVALKLLRPEHARNPDLLQRFFQEARTVNQISHEHIVEIFDFVDESAGDGRVYYVMELLQGKSLSDLLESEPLAVSRIAALGVQVCDALEAAHRVGVVHRDIKPDNLFVVKRPGEPDYVKVLDFGVAKLTSPLEGLTRGQTLEGLIIGTPDYMSPEQARGRAADARSDIYGVGTVLYQLLCGRLPFDGPSLGELLTQVVRTPPRALPRHTVAGEPIPEALREVVQRCLEKEPEDRYASMAALGEALRPFTTPGFRPGRSRRRQALAAAASVAVVLAVGGVARFGRGEQTPGEPPASPLLEAHAERVPAALPDLVVPEARAAIAEARATQTVREQPGITLPAVQRTRAPRAARPAKAPLKPKRSLDAVIDPFDD